MTATLYFKDERSDKQYSVALTPDGDLFNVDAAWGRRNGTQTPGRKTPKALPFSEAKAVFDGLVQEKLAKGYRPGEDAPEFQDVSQMGTTARDSRGQVNGIPTHMLLNPITSEAELERFMADDEWLLQPKYDGIRARVSKQGDRVTGLSRTHKAVSLPLNAVKTARAFLSDFDIDVEMIGDELVVLDVLQYAGIRYDEKPCQLRADRVARLSWPIGFVPTVSAVGADDKRTLAQAIFAQGMEGLVFKRRSAKYTAGRPASGGDARKFKYRNSASVIVIRPTPNKRSVEIGLYDGTALGHVTIPPNHEMPPTGSVIEVEGLYLGSAKGHVVQAVYKGVRDDVDPSDCGADQFHVKGEARWGG